MMADRNVSWSLAYNQSPVSPAASALVFMLSTFREPASLQPLYIFLFTSVYLLTMAGNVLLVAAIVLDRRLHRPMFVLLAQLAACDLAGSSATLPGIVRNIATSDGLPLATCLAQMYVAHVYGGLAGLLLSAMAVDRTLAICWPLRYQSLATNGRAAAAGGAIAAFVGGVTLGLVGLAASLELCGPRIVTMPHCDHFSVVRMACGDAAANRLYDAAMKTTILTVSITVVLVSYGVVALWCSDAGLRAGRCKAARTCVTHIIVFLVLEVSVMLLIVQNHIQRYFSTSAYLPVYLVINFHVVPPLLNPIVYGLRTEEIRHSVRRMFGTKVLPSRD